MYTDATERVTLLPVDDPICTVDGISEQSQK